MKWQRWILLLLFINIAMLGEVFAAGGGAGISFDKGFPQAGPKGSAKIIGSGMWVVPDDTYTVRSIQLVVTPTQAGQQVGDSPAKCDVKSSSPTSGSFTGSVTGLQPGTYNVSAQMRATSDGKPDFTPSTVPVQVTVQ